LSNVVIIPAYAPNGLFRVKTPDGRQLYPEKAGATALRSCQEWCSEHGHEATMGERLRGASVDKVLAVVEGTTDVPGSIAEMQNIIDTMEPTDAGLAFARELDGLCISGGIPAQRQRVVARLFDCYVKGVTA
jgi:hypothetical protein